MITIFLAQVISQRAAKCLPLLSHSEGTMLVIAALLPELSLLSPHHTEIRMPAKQYQ
jgi:hypothetical protein